MGKFADALRKQYIDALAKEGDRIMKECLQEKEYQNRTGALASSYGWAVYYHGRIVKGDISPDIQRWNKKFNGKDISGSQMIVDLIDEGGFKVPQSSRSMGLIIIAAVPYGEYLENGTNFAHRKYKVISMSYDKLKEISAKYGKASVRTILHGKMQM